MEPPAVIIGWGATKERGAVALISCRGKGARTRCEALPPRAVSAGTISVDQLKQWIAAWSYPILDFSLLPCKLSNSYYRLQVTHGT
jgi:hypothetical protein